jgi:hypothetical protein
MVYTIKKLEWRLGCKTCIVYTGLKIENNISVLYCLNFILLDIEVLLIWFIFVIYGIN